MTDREHLETAIAGLEAQRAALGDAVVDAALAPLRARLARVRGIDRQRRQVTVLFMDIVGSTALVAGLDPEDASALTEEALERLSAPVSDRGGRVTRFMGDGFLAVFGLHKGSDTDPVEAVHAGLEILSCAADYARDTAERWGIEGFDVRVGIDTGLVVVGGYSESQDTLAGTTVNLASRIESSAQAGTVVVSRRTYRLARGSFDMTELDPIQAKGFDEPVPVYRVDRAKPRSFVTVRGTVAGVEADLAGRGAELDELRQAFTASANGCTTVRILAEPGLGKSRLLREFEAWIDLLPERALLLRGRALPQTGQRYYGLLRDLIAFRFEIRDDTSASDAITGLERGLRPWLGPGGAESAASIARLAGFGAADDVDPKEVRDRALRAFVDFLAAASTAGSIVMLLDDIQWADEASLDFIDDLTLALPDTPLLVAAAARPDFHDRRPTWGGLVSEQRLVRLGPLSTTDARTAVTSILRDRIADGGDQVIDTVVERAGGNPFFAEELIRSLIDDGIIDTAQDPWHIDADRMQSISVPPTLTGVIQGRVDALDPPERAVLQQAAVVGRHFWTDALAAIDPADRDLDALCRELERREFIAAVAESSIEGLPEWSFHSDVTRDVVYEGVLRSQRVAYHARVADWLGRLAAERPVELNELLADHLERSGDHAGAAAALEAAGRRAAAGFANAAAIAHFTRALGLLGDDAIVERFEIVREREDVAFLTSDRDLGRGDVAELERLGELLGDPDHRAVAALRALRLASATLDHEQIEALGTRALALATEAARPDLEAEAALAWTRYLMYADPGGTDVMADRARTVAARAGLPRLEGAALRAAGVAAFERGDLAIAERVWTEALEIAERTGDEHARLATLTNLGNVAFSRNDYTEARRSWEASLEGLSTMGDRELAWNPMNNLAVLSSDLGDFETAADLGNRVLRLAREIRSRRGEAFALSLLGGVAESRGLHDDALAIYREGLDVARDAGERMMTGYHLSGIGQVLISQGRFDEAIVELRKAVAEREVSDPGGPLAESLAALAFAHASAGDTDSEPLGRAITALREADLFRAENPERAFLLCLRTADLVDPEAVADLERDAREFVRRQIEALPESVVHPPWRRGLIARLGL
jgi:predicted ATPase/class 3 adenylate cyclase